MVAASRMSAIGVESNDSITTDFTPVFGQRHDGIRFISFRWFQTISVLYVYTKMISYNQGCCPGQTLPPSPGIYWRILQSGFFPFFLSNCCWQEMDVSYSIDVTDDGIRVLCNPHHQTAVGQEKPLPPLLRCRKISAPASSSTAGCLVWFPRFVSGMRRRYSVIEHQANNNRQPEEDLSSVRWPEEDDTSITDTDGQSCINSLCRIDLTGTSVTSSAVQLVLATSPKLSVNF